MSIRVILADDHAIVREGVRSLLQGAGIQVVGEAQNGMEAVALTRRLRPDVAVLDLSMPIMNGIEAAGQIRAELGIPCILLSMHDDIQYVIRALSIGASGYVLKRSACACLIEAVTTVLSGQIYLSPAVAEKVTDALLDETSEEEQLNLRERQALQLIAEGYTTKEVAARIGMGSRTGEAVRKYIMDKLKIHDTAGLVRYAIRRGIIQE